MGFESDLVSLFSKEFQERLGRRINQRMAREIDYTWSLVVQIRSDTRDSKEFNF